MQYFYFFFYGWIVYRRILQSIPQRLIIQQYFCSAGIARCPAKFQSYIHSCSGMAERPTFPQ